MAEKILTAPSPAERPLGRHPRDLVALVAAAVVVVLCSLIARRPANPVEVAIFQQFQGIPAMSGIVWRVLDWAGGWAGVAAVSAVALYVKRFRLGLQCAAAGALAWALVLAVHLVTGSRAVPAALLATHGMRLPGPEGFPFPSSHAAVAAVMTAVASPYLKGRYRRLAWIAVVLVAAAGVYLGKTLPLGAFAGVFLGWGLGALFHLVWGAPGRQTSATAVWQALAQAGLDPLSVAVVRGHALGPLEFIATTSAGDRLRVEVVRRLHRRAGPWYRLRRLLVSLQVEDEPRLSSTYHEAEHEALVTLLAQQGGVPTPPIVLACRAPDGSSLLVRRQIDGRRLTELPPAEVDDALLEAIWCQLVKLGDNRIAHHDLRAKNVLVDTEGRPWLLNLTFGKAGAAENRTVQDIAEALVSTASVVGVERAVDTAARVLHPDRLEPAMAYLQPLALPGRIRKQLGNHRSVLADLRETLAERIERPLPTFRSPLRPSNVVGLVLFGAAVYTLLPQLANLRAVGDALSAADWRWLAATVLAGLLAIVLSAVSMRGASLAPLPFWRTTLVQVAAAFTGRTTPGGVGFFGINIAFMERLHIRRSAALGVAVLNIAATGVVGGIWSVAGAFGLGTSGLLRGLSVPHGWPVAAAVAGLVVVVAVVLASPFGRRRVVRPAVRVARELGTTMRQPRRAVQLFGGAAAYLGLSGAGLATSLAAFGYPVPVAAVLTVFVIGHTFGHIIPTPGGIGAVESLTVAGLTALGTPPTTAVLAVLTSRVLTYWLPIVPGIATFRYLQHRGAI